MSRAHLDRISKRSKGDPAEASNRVESWSWILVWGGLVAMGAGLSPSLPGDYHRAYLDPGSGSFLIQALVALVAGVAVALRTYRERIWTFLGLSKSDSAEADVPGSDD